MSQRQIRKPALPPRPPAARIGIVVHLPTILLWVLATRSAAFNSVRAFAADETLDGATRRDASPEAGRELFNRHCIKCHGPDGTGSPARPKFAEIPDFSRPQWHERRNDSQLIHSICNGKGANMPSFERKISAVQIRDLVAYVRTLGEDEEKDIEPEPAFVVKLVRWLGKFHPVMVHFPVALLLAAAVAELLLMLTGRAFFDAASRYCVWFGALGAVPAAMLGWLLAGAHLSDANWILTTHRWLGTSTVVCAGFVLLLSEISRRRSNHPARTGFRLALLFNVLLVVATGFFGGALIHPLDYYSWPR